MRPTNVAATICHVLSPVFSQLGYGTGTTAPSTVRVLLSCGQCVLAPRAMSRRHTAPGAPSPRQAGRPAAERMQRTGFGTVTPVLPTRELGRPSVLQGPGVPQPARFSFSGLAGEGRLGRVLRGV